MPDFAGFPDFDLHKSLNIISFICVWRPGAAGGDFKYKSDFLTQKLTFYRIRAIFAKSHFLRPRARGCKVSTPVCFVAHVERI